MAHTEEEPASTADSKEKRTTTTKGLRGPRSHQCLVVALRGLGLSVWMPLLWVWNVLEVVLSALVLNVLGWTYHSKCHWTGHEWSWICLQCAP